ncbi:MAG: hypothetical protein RH982_16870 [Parvibaculum sp.]
MTYVERPTTFPLAGPAAWPACSPPAWRRFIQPPGSPSIVWSADFAAGLYSRGGAPATLSEMVDCVRPSDAIMQGADGVHHVFAANEPPILPGAGLDIWGELSSLVRNGNNLAAAGWSAAMGITANDLGTTALGIFREVELVGGGSLGARRVQNIALSSGIPVFVSFFYKAGSSGRLRAQILGSGADNLVLRGIVGGIAVSAISGGTLSDLVNTDFGGGIYHCSCLWTPENPGVGVGVGIGPDSGVADATVVALGLDVVSALTPVPWISNTTPAPTRLGTDLTIPGFSSLVSEYGLQAGFRSRDVIHLTRLSSPVHRCLWSRGTDAENCVTLELRTDDRLRLTVRNGGMDALILETAEGFNDSGVKTINAVCRTGNWSIEAAGLPSAHSAAPATIPALAEAHIGRTLDAPDNYLSGVILASEVERIS